MQKGQEKERREMDTKKEERQWEMIRHSSMMESVVVDGLKGGMEKGAKRETAGI